MQEQALSKAYVDFNQTLEAWVTGPEKKSNQLNSLAISSNYPQGSSG
jgi:hypothetical protein